MIGGFISPLAFGQASLSKTTLGKSQNSSQDMMNSLVPGPQRVGKGEKKEEVDPKKLQSKTVKDTTFSGGLNDVGLDWGGNAMGKPHASGDTDAKSSKQSEVDAKKAPAKPADASENPQGKDKESKSTSSKPEKQPDKEKSVDTEKR
jgi:hypothetical protein